MFLGRLILFQARRDGTTKGQSEFCLTIDVRSTFKERVLQVSKELEDCRARCYCFRCQRMIELRILSLDAKANAIC